MAFEPTTIIPNSVHVAVNFSGYSVRESGGKKIVLVEFLERDDTGAILHSFELQPKEPRDRFFPEDLVGPLRHPDLYVKVTGAGVIVGVIYTRLDR